MGRSTVSKRAAMAASSATIQTPTQRGQLSAILKFPNGICIASDNQSILFAETWGCTVKRYWFDGPKTGQIEMVLDNLPGYPDNINLASDGNYWLALVGMRSPAFDLAGECRFPTAHGETCTDR